MSLVSLQYLIFCRGFKEWRRNSRIVFDITLQHSRSEYQGIEMRLELIFQHRVP